jgi:CubicO group peptidase (beta-lactamase class C family)
LREFAPERGSVNPGEFWLYSNWDFNLAGYVFEKETGKNIYDEVERQLAIPLGMQDWDRSLQHKSGDTTISRYLAYHMWFSTRDLARIGQLMLNGGRWNGEQVIAEEWVREIISPVTSSEEINLNLPFFAAAGMDRGYGYMWWLWENVPHPNLVGAYSASGAWGQSITVYPEMDVILTFKTNSIYRRANDNKKLNDLIVKVARMYDADKGAVKGRLYESFQERAIEEAVTYFREARNEKPELNLEYFLNTLGYEFLAGRDFEKALAVFKLNVEEYPESWNAYDSLAEGYEQSGDIRNAVRYYKQSLEMEPRNSHARERLKILHSKYPTI